MKGLYENSIIVMYGDHYGISENHNEAMCQYLGKEVTPFVSAQLQHVPIDCSYSRSDGQGKGKTISKVSGQIDLKPTLLHLLGVDTKKDIQFGGDLFSDDHQDLLCSEMVVLLQRTMCIQMMHAIRKRQRSQSMRHFVSHIKKRSRVELDYSDKIIYGDLLRFYEDEQNQISEIR